ncbi:MAG: pyridoxal phosphate-dependent aminotransferase [Deltaproteobacteria bacterium]|nr:MAG: pyridoxal phosphate-dependent aminotransferase [Deltaproteobacteria bacterium]
MAIANRIKQNLTGASLIRLVADEGLQMRQQSDKPVWDLSIGNPVYEPPQEFRNAIIDFLRQDSSGYHRYMPNNGHLSARAAVAQQLEKELGWDSISPDCVMMTVGCAGGISLTLKVLLDPGDEVIILSPYFVEYKFYIEGHQGVPVVVPSTPEFQLDIAAIEQALTTQTKAILINTPNNPTGVAYNKESITQLSDLLRAHKDKTGKVVYLLNDSPYYKLMYDESSYVDPLKHYEHTILMTSFSKSLSIPGERIGFVFASPTCEDLESFVPAMAFASRVVGFVNAPALMQHVIPKLVSLPTHVNEYKAKLERLGGALKEAGYEMVWPDGTFYLFPKAPGGDDMAFFHALKEHRVLVVPGSGFGWPGHFRISYCVDDSVIEHAIPAFEAVAKQFLS